MKQYVRAYCNYQRNDWVEWYQWRNTFSMQSLRHLKNWSLSWQIMKLNLEFWSHRRDQQSSRTTIKTIDVDITEKMKQIATSLKRIQLRHRKVRNNKQTRKAMKIRISSKWSSMIIHQGYKNNTTLKEAESQDDWLV